MLINTYVARRLTLVSSVSVNASKVISPEYIWTTSLPSYLHHIVSCKKGHLLHLALSVLKSKKKKKLWLRRFLRRTFYRRYTELLWNLCLKKIHFVISASYWSPFPDHSLDHVITGEEIKTGCIEILPLFHSWFHNKILLMRFYSRRWHAVRAPYRS